jgi:formylmethanofuran dehydrogenase subunit E
LIEALNKMMMPMTAVSRATRTLSELLDESAARHQHLCPRQVLGARMGLLGTRWLGFDIPNAAKRLLVIVETDGCFADGLSVATGCTVGARTLRLIDHGKVAAAFVDTKTDRAVRFIPSKASRSLAREYAPLARSPWHAQLEAYQIMPDAELFDVQPIELTLSLEKLLSKPGRKAICDQCGEEIINEREVSQDGQTLCRACAGNGYWRRRQDL